MLRDFRPPARPLLAALAIAVATTACGIKKPLTHPPKAPPSGTAAPAEAPPVEPREAVPADAAPSRL